MTSVLIVLLLLHLKLLLTILYYLNSSDSHRFSLLLQKHLMLLVTGPWQEKLYFTMCQFDTVAMWIQLLEMSIFTFIRVKRYVTVCQIMLAH